MVELTLEFSLVECSCGATRQAGVTCGNCGARGEEVDEALDNRQRIVGRLRFDRRPERVDDPLPVTLDELWPLLGAWLSDFLAAFERVGEGNVEEAAGRLQGQLDELNSLRVRVGATPKLRPEVSAWRNAERILGIYGTIAAHYVAALVAPTPVAAEAEAQAAQAAIDEASTIIDRFNIVNDEAARLADADLADEYSDVIVGAGSAYLLSGAGDLVAFERAGRPLFERITGSSDCPVGLGVGCRC